MKREGGGRLTEPVADFTGWETLRPFLDQQAKDVEASLLRHRTERRDHV